MLQSNAIGYQSVAGYPGFAISKRERKQESHRISLSKSVMAHLIQRVPSAATVVAVNVNQERGTAVGQSVSYLRVSTARQGASGLGMDAQRAAVYEYLNGGNWTLVSEVVEVKSGKRNDRPAIAEALRLCRLHRATLIIGKLDRLARNVHFISSLMEAGIEFVACDFPQANRFIVPLLSAVAEHEAAMISARTVAALKAAKARGKVLGGRRVPNERMAAIAKKGNARSALVRCAAATKRRQDLLPVIQELCGSGTQSLQHIAKGLTARGILTARGKEWSPTQVRRVLADRTPSI